MTETGMPGALQHSNQRRSIANQDDERCPDLPQATPREHEQCLPIHPGAPRLAERFASRARWAFACLLSVVAATGPAAYTPLASAPGPGPGPIIVAIVDSGVRVTHHDLQAHLWRSPTDGTFGFSALNGAGNPDDENGHGTQIAGLVVAPGDDLPNDSALAAPVRIMACQFLDRTGLGTIEDAIQCLDFARIHGAHIVNASWTLDTDSPDLLAAFERLRDAGIVVVAAAGNSARDIDLAPTFPASYALENIVTVTAIDPAGAIPFFANVGAASVDLAAPGVGLRSAGHATDQERVDVVPSTSASAALVSRALALSMIQHPHLSWQERIARLLYSVDPHPRYESGVRSAGRLDSSQLLRLPATGPRIRLVPRPDRNGVQLIAWADPRAEAILESSPWPPGWTAQRTLEIDATGYGRADIELASADQARFFRLRLARAGGD